MVQQWLMLIMFLNFFTAMVFEAYEQSLSKTTANEYKLKCQLNMETENLLFYLGLKQRHEFFILTGAI